MAQVEQVTEVEIAAAKAEIGADGIGCEPASAVTLAGLKKLRRSGFVKAGESVVLILTGHLLKDPDFTIKFHRGDLFAGTPDEADAFAGEISSARARLCSMLIWGGHCRPRRGREKFVALHRKFVYKTQFNCRADCTILPRPDRANVFNFCRFGSGSMTVGKSDIHAQPLKGH